MKQGVSSIGIATFALGSTATWIQTSAFQPLLPLGQPRAGSSLTRLQSSPFDFWDPFDAFTRSSRNGGGSGPFSSSSYLKQGTPVYISDLNMMPGVVVQQDGMGGGDFIIQVNHPTQGPVVSVSFWKAHDDG